MKLTNGRNDGEEAVMRSSEFTPTSLATYCKKHATPSKSFQCRNYYSSSETCSPDIPHHRPDKVRKENDWSTWARTVIWELQANFQEYYQ